MTTTPIMSSTVLIVVAADRGHFQWVLPFVRRLMATRKNTDSDATIVCEIWTHQVCKEWIPSSLLDQHGDHIIVKPFLGRGKELLHFIAAYKWAVSAGNSDAEGYQSALKENGGLVQAYQRFGIHPDTVNDASIEDWKATPAGRQQLYRRLAQENVMGVVWERNWCDWVPKECSTTIQNKNKRSVGVMPSFLAPFRAHCGIPILSFDGVCRVRDQASDVNPPVPAGSTVAFVIADCLCGDIPIPTGCTQLGPFLEDPHPPSGDLQRWLAGSEHQRNVVLVSLGRQDALASLSSHATASVLVGCLAAAPRVLAAGIPANSLADMQTHPALRVAMKQDRLKCLSWIPQWQVLCSSHVCAFVSHCGANSTYEAPSQAVPIVPLPFFDDQHYIAAQLEDLYYKSKDDKNETSSNSRNNYKMTRLRKADLRQPSRDRAVSAVKAAVEAALTIPPEILQSIQQSIREQDGVSKLVDLLLSNTSRY